MKKFLICDIETEKLLNPEYIWCAVTIDVQTNVVKRWTNLHVQNEEFRDYVQDYVLVGHNFINFDWPVLCSHISGLTCKGIVDTLVISRFLYSWKQKKHGLGHWGELLGFPKGDFTDFAGGLTDEMLDYCEQDCQINLKLWQKVRPYYEKFESQIRLEHEVAELMTGVRNNGFGFDIELANKTHKEIQEKIDELDRQIQQEFPPKIVAIREVTPRLTKLGRISAQDFRWLNGIPEKEGYTADASFTRIEYVPFNPNSTKQVVERFHEFGWKPVNKTKGHIDALKERPQDKEKLERFAKYGWKVDEDNIATLPDTAPASARLIADYILLSSRLSTLDEWLGSYNAHTKSLHPSIIHIGAWTHRCSHKEPNSANIPRTTTPYGEQFRSMWQAREGRVLIGCDASGIQLRVLSHYMNDPVFQEALLNGDPHALNRDNLKLEATDVNRTRAKTFIYAWLLGAASVKVGEILECSPKEASERVKYFVEAYPGLKQLKEKEIPRNAQRGFFIGLDGRPIQCDSEHLMLAGYLQAGESVIMKTAMKLWTTEANNLGLPYWLVNFVHDEWQTETIDDNDVIEQLKQIQINSIEKAGEVLQMRCPQAGEAKHGYNWKDTH